MNSRPTVIVATQDGAMHDLVKRLLEAEGCDVISPKIDIIAEVARSIISEERDIILAIADYALPGMSGVALIADLQVALDKAHLPYFLISSRPQSDGRHLLYKPFTPQEFLAAVHERVSPMTLDAR
jgi:DNA-binding response OmpR family regulator